MVCLIFLACNSNKKDNSAALNDSLYPAQEQTAPSDKNSETADINLDWSNIPDLKNIGDFPFIKAPKGLKIEREEQGMTQVFEYEELTNYLGPNNYYVSTGKLGMIFMEFDDSSYNNRYFDKNIFNYLDQIGAKKLYSGEIIRDEVSKVRLKGNMYSGKNRTSGTDDTAPISIYAFKNNGKKYLINVQSNSAIGVIYVMELNDFESSVQKYTAQSMQSDIDKSGKSIVQIHFDTDKSALKPEAQQIADQIVQLLKDDSSLKLSIEGHTDNTGDPRKNIQLSKERAQAVVTYLVNEGISSSRLKSNGFGAEKALFANDSEDNKAKNRRVELVKFN